MRGFKLGFSFVKGAAAGALLMHVGLRLVAALA